MRKIAPATRCVVKTRGILPRWQCILNVRVNQPRLLAHISSESASDPPLQLGGRVQLGTDGKELQAARALEPAPRRAALQSTLQQCTGGDLPRAFTLHITRVIWRDRQSAMSIGLHNIASRPRKMADTMCQATASGRNVATVLGAPIISGLRVPVRTVVVIDSVQHCESQLRGIDPKITFIG